MIEQSDNITDLAVALSKAQAQVEGAKKDSANPHFKSKYADLESVWDACREALTSNGLSVLQAPGLTHDGVMHMTTQLCHASGQWIRQEMSLPLSKVDAQGAGSALTYMRRYALAAFVGVAPEDDDGNAASKPAQGAVSNDKPAAASGGRQQPPPLGGPIKTRKELRIACSTFKNELDACEDDHALEAFLSTPASIALVQQVQEEHALFWNGDGREFKGLQREMAEARNRAAMTGQPF